MIAKYRKDGNKEEWWLTNFTMEFLEDQKELVDLRNNYPHDTLFENWLDSSQRRYGQWNRLCR